jgi:hypothetical protein
LSAILRSSVTSEAHTDMQLSVSGVERINSVSDTCLLELRPPGQGDLHGSEGFKSGYRQGAVFRLGTVPVRRESVAVRELCLAIPCQDVEAPHCLTPSCCEGPTFRLVMSTD